MNTFLKKYLQGDLVIWIVFFALCIISIIELYSAVSTLAYSSSSHTKPILSHVIFLAIGGAIAFGIHFIPSQVVRFLSYAGLVFSTILLILVPFIGVTENDSARWIEIFGFRFQPSEIAKLSVVIVIADLISRIKGKENEQKYYKYIMGILIINCSLILTANLSTAVLLYGVCTIMMFVGRISFRRIIIPIVLLVSLMVMGYYAVKTIPYESMPNIGKRSYTWVGRIDRMFEKDDDSQKYVINDMNRQEQHAKIAVARGGIFGVMPGNSIQRDYLPQAFADFIYAIIVEEMGLVGGIFVIILYLILLFRAGAIAVKTTSTYVALLVIGLATMIVVQAFISMAVSVGIGPVTGQPLPLISRGGTSVIITCVYFGIMLGVSREIKREQIKQELVQAESEQNVPVIHIDQL